MIGRFGTKVERSWDPTFGLNTKRGMDNNEFEQYVLNSILPLYPHTCDRPGKRLLLKCNSGPRRLQIKLLAKLHFLGIYLYPCMPNTTAVTQETYRTYGKFKGQYQHNLELLFDELVRQDKSVSVPQYKHGLLVFGRVDDVTGLVLESLFELGFSREQCLNMTPPLLKEWTTENEEELTRISNREIDMTETYLGRYAALQKRRRGVRLQLSLILLTRNGIL